MPNKFKKNKKYKSVNNNLQYKKIIGNNSIIPYYSDLDNYKSAYIKNNNNDNNIQFGSERDFFGITNIQNNDQYNIIATTPLNILKDKIYNISNESIEKYGVGPCNPRAFYGTFDCHLKLEHTISSLFNMQKAICYPSWKQMVESIPSSCIHNKNDLFITDEYCRVSIDEGLKLVKCKKCKFKHNDLEDLKNIIDNHIYKFPDTKKYNIFIYIEGLYLRDGSICVILKEIIQLSMIYESIKIILDDTLAIGILGNNLKGTVDLFNLSWKDNIWLLLFGFESTFGTTGSICIGSTIDINNQHISAPGFTFSASLPPYSCLLALNNICYILNDHQYFKSLLDIVNNKISNIFPAANDNNHQFLMPLFHIYLTNLNKFTFHIEESKFYIKGENIDIRYNMRIDICNKLNLLSRDIENKFNIRIPLIGITEENELPRLRCFITYNNHIIFKKILKYVLEK